MVVDSLLAAGINDREYLGSFLLLSRNSAIPNLVQSNFTIGGLSQEDSIEILLHKSIGVISSLSKEDISALETVARRFGGHPQALEYASAYIRHESLTFSKFVQLYDSKPGLVARDLSILLDNFGLQTLSHLALTLLKIFSSLEGSSILESLTHGETSTKIFSRAEAFSMVLTLKPTEYFPVYPDEKELSTLLCSYKS